MTDPDAAADHRVVVHLDTVLQRRGMSLTRLAELVDVSVVNLLVFKNGRACAVRFTTLTRICHVLQYRPGDLLSVLALPPAPPDGAAHQ